MRLGVHVVSFNIDGGPAAIGPTLARVGEAAERAGVANLSAMDHYLQVMGDATEPMLEGYTTLAFLAAHTRSVELQLLVTGVTYRHPGLLTKIVSTLDVLSSLEPTAAGGAAFAEQMQPYAQIGIEEVHVMPFTSDPVAFVDGLGEHVVPHFSRL
jgi:hypothetical protein